MASTTTSSGNEEVVKLNVGGKHFTTYKSTLMAYPDTMLARMFSSSAEIAKKGNDGEYFLDRNPELFNIILEFYRNKALIVPKSTPLEALYNELQYFGIDYEEDDIQIAGEPKHAPIECFLSLVDAYKSLSKKGHLLGNVIVGLPLGDYEEEEEEEEEDEDEDEDGNGAPKVNNAKEAKTKKLFESIGAGHNKRQLFGNLPDESESDLSDLSDLSISSEDEEDDGPKKKKTKKDSDQNKVSADNTDKQPENGPYEKGTAAVMEKIKDSLSEISSDSFFCCGGIDRTTTPVQLKILPLPPKSNNNNNNSDDLDNIINKPVCQYGANCYRKNPLHIQDFFHPSPSSLKVVQKKNSYDPRVDCGDLANLNIDLIKSLCSPAPFGDLKTMQTKLDPNVRLALECNSDRFDLPLYLKGITDYIMLKLNSNHRVQLVPYKLNIYEPGGFFKEHVDTPIQPDKMLGSLVICLPSLHEGGELKVTHNGQSHTFDFAPKSGNTGIFQWAAFYSDCVHEVMPVTKGTRITVTYLINDKKGDKFYHGSYGSKTGKSFCGPPDPTLNSAKIDKLVGILEELPSSIVKLGWLLNHKYTTTAINKETLKGSDKLMIEKIGNKWDYHLTSIVYNLYTKNYVGEYDSKEFNEKSGSVYAFSMEDLKYLNGKGPKPNHKFTHVPFIVSSQKGKLLYQNEDAGAEHTGNESRPAESDSVYFHAAVIVTRK